MKKILPSELEIPIKKKIWLSNRYSFAPILRFRTQDFMIKDFVKKIADKGFI